MWMILDWLVWNIGLDFASQVGVGHFYHIYYEGCLTNFEIEGHGEEASKLYPEVHYKRMDEYLKLYLWWSIQAWKSMFLCFDLQIKNLGISVII